MEQVSGESRRGAASPSEGRSQTPARRPLRRLLPLAVFIGAAAAVWIAAGAASAHHANATCMAGGFSQVWSGTTTLANVSVFTDECILVRGDIVLPVGAFVHFRDTQLTLAVNDSSVGNITIYLGTNSTWKMGDVDDNPSTGLDRSLLEVWSASNTTGFFFSASVNASVYINDTIIRGGGLPGNNVSSRSGIFFANLTDFAWNRVDHTTWANGLLLVNYSKAGTSSLYTVQTGFPAAQGAIGLYLAQVGNRTFESIATRQMSFGVVVNDSTNISFLWFNASALVAGLTANRVVQLLLQDFTDFAHRAVGVDLNSVVNATIRRAKLTPAVINSSSYGIDLDFSRNITIRDVEIANHVVADLRMHRNTQNLWVQNATIRGAMAAVTRGVWADEQADIFRLSNFTFEDTTIFSRGEGVNFSNVGGAVFRNTTISSILTNAFTCAGCFDVLFADGTLTQVVNGANLNGANLTLERTLISNNQVGVLVGDCNFAIERVTFQSNTRSIFSAGASRIGPSSIANSTVPAGGAADAVQLTGWDTSAFTRLLVYNNSFTNPNFAPTVWVGLRLTTFGRIDVVNNTFFSLPVVVTGSGTLVATGNTHRVSLLPLNAVVILFDNSSSLTVARDTFLAPTPPLGIGTVVRAPFLTSQATVRDMRLPAADFGVWLSASPGATLVTTGTLANLSVFARRDALTALGLNSVAVDDVAVDGSVNAVVLFGGGTSQDLAVRASFLTASATAVNFTADSAGRVTVADIAINRSGALPARVISIQGGSLATIARIGLDGSANGIVTSDTRRVALSEQNFTNNAIGLRMDAPSAASVVLNWTVGTATRVENSSLRFVGEVTVAGVPLTLRNASISIFALTSDPRFSRFFFEGASCLTVADGTRIVTEPASGGRIQDSRFTLQLSAAACVSLTSAPGFPRVMLEGLGDIASTALSEQGILLQGADAVIANVNFINVSRALLADGVNIRVQNCTFVGVSGALAAVTVWAGGSARMSNVVVNNGDGIEATDADAYIDNSTFSPAGIVLFLSNAHASLNDSVVQFATSVVEADAASLVEVHRLVARNLLVVAFDADGASSINVSDSYLDGGSSVLDAAARNGAAINFECTVVDRYGARGRVFNVQTIPGGTFTAFCTLRFAVCVLSSRTWVSGAGVNVSGGDGPVIFADTTGPAGLTGPLHFLEYESRGGVDVYRTPLGIEAALGALSSTQTIVFTNQTVVELCLDDVPPVFAQPTVLPALTPLANWEIRVTVFDEHSGLEPGSPCFSMNGGNCEPKGESRMVDSVTVTVNVVLTEGPNALCFVARDLFANEARLCLRPTLDRDPPEIVVCNPPASWKTRNASVELVCQIAGGPRGVVFSGIIPESFRLDPDGTLHAVLVLQDGVNQFQFSVNDSVGNINQQRFGWTLDATPPALNIQTDLARIVTQPRVLITGTAPSDTAELLFNGHKVNLTGGAFSFFWDLEEGPNNANLSAVDDVGNGISISISVTRDMTTNCRVVTPAKGAQTGDSPLLVAGRCDPDVVLTVNTEIGVPVALDGSWSVHVNLASGVNKIVLSGRDANGATWYDEVQVYYEAGSGPGGSGLLLVLVLLAVGTLVAAFLISRRPRGREPEPVYRLQTGAQKAPPRPKPMTVKLPETPDDMTYRPRAPPPPPPPK